MKTNLRFLALSAAILSMFTACQREELEQNQKPEALTHSVTFVAGAPETKTTVDISDEKTAKFKWTKADEDRFTAYENGTEALETVGVLDVKTGIMSLVATFDGKRPESASYVAVVNKSNATQTMSAEAYDEKADILVSKAVSSFDGEKGVQLQFKREVAIAKMTLKKLDAGEVINKVTVSSNAEIAGSYGVDGWASPAASSIEISSTSAKEVGVYKIVANEAGEAVVWFTCIPQDAATLTVKVEAADGDTYTKEFKPITLTSGDVKAFGVAMAKLVDPEGGWVKTDISAISASDIVVIVGGDYGIRNDEGTSSSPDVVSVTISNNKITSVVPDNIKWNISGNSTDGYVFYPNGDSTKWLYCNTTQSSSSNNNIRVGTGDRKQWKPDENGYFVNTVGGTETYVMRVLSINGTSDWRSYINTENNPQKLEFYVLQSSGSSEGGSDPVKLAAPSVSCTARTETSLTFSWAAVANASGYQVSVDGGNSYGTTLTETTYIWTGLTANTTKKLYVKAIGDGTNYTDSEAASAEDTTTSGSGGGENPGVTTVSLDETEIRDLGKLAYTDLKTINDGKVTWTVYAYKDNASRPWLQLKKDSNIYVKISAPSAIKEVRLTITSATNSKGGAEDISKHSAYSSSGTISLKSADAAGDTTKNDVVSCTGNAISNNNVTLVPNGSYNDLYLKVSAGARIWGIEVDY
ncbi:MAG: fibronectin type III domain-containing protein [Rikenellaceae bacterium]|nr:fibronectin type III domain-containing protein [Rikenellaceae bacterium]